MPVWSDVHDPEDEIRDLLEQELGEFDLLEDDLETAAEIAGQVQVMSEAAAEASDEPLVLAAARTAHLLAGEAIDEEISEDTAAGQGPACAAGCSACCHIPVSATAADVAALVVWLDEQPAALRRDVEQRVRDALPRATGQEERGALPCPLLDLKDGTCRAYAVRPLACRGCFSDDASQCIPGGTIRAFVAPQVIARSAAIGVRLALREAGEYDESIDLIVGLAEVLDVDS